MMTPRHMQLCDLCVVRLLYYHRPGWMSEPLASIITSRMVHQSICPVHVVLQIAGQGAVGKRLPPLTTDTHTLTALDNLLGYASQPRNLPIGLRQAATKGPPPAQLRLPSVTIRLDTDNLVQIPSPGPHGQRPLLLPHARTRGNTRAAPNLIVLREANQGEPLRRAGMPTPCPRSLREVIAPWLRPTRVHDTVLCMATLG